MPIDPYGTTPATYTVTSNGTKTDVTADGWTYDDRNNAVFTLAGRVVASFQWFDSIVAKG